MSSSRSCSSSSSKVLTPRFLVITSSPSGWGSSGLCDSSGGDSCLCRGTTPRSVVGACVCIAVCDLPARGVRVGVRLHLCGQGLRLSLRGSGARVHCRARWCAATSLWARIALVSPCFWCSCSLPYVTSSEPLRALVYGYGLWARIALVSPWLWCSAPLRALVLDTAHGQGFRLSPCGPGAHRHCARWYAVPFFGQGLRLPLRGPGAQRHCARWYADTAYGQGLRLSLRGPGTHVFSAGHLRRPGLLGQGCHALIQRCITVEVPQLQFLFKVVNIPVGALMLDVQVRQAPWCSL